MCVPKVLQIGSSVVGVVGLLGADTGGLAGTVRPDARGGCV